MLNVRNNCNKLDANIRNSYDYFKTWCNGFKGFELNWCFKKVSGRKTVGFSEVVLNDGLDPQAHL